MKHSAKLDDLWWESWDSPFGTITVGCSEKGVRRLALGPPPSATKKAAQRGASRAAGLARKAIAELRQYASGERSGFTVPLDLQGTPFQLKVWKALLCIPYGQTRSYQQIARQTGNPRASRAVGMANHHNPVAIMVPCHRVIASDGSLGGYAGGLELKAKILSLEKTGKKV